MFRLFTLIIAIVLSLGTTTVLAEDDDYVPVFGQGEHTVWDEEAGDFGNTYTYYASPTDYGWFANVVAEGAHSYVVFVCFYYEEDDRVSMATRFALTSGLPFAEEEVSASVAIGEREAVEFTYYRHRNNAALLEETVSGFDLSRASETFTVTISPFEFEHSIKGLFDVPAAQNLIWCDDR